MKQCYHENACFTDPVFPNLRGKRIKAMWHMLCESGKDLKINYQILKDNSGTIKAEWNATYAFGKTQRVVYNSVKSVFIIKDDLIIDHKDSFDLWKWSGMALGIPGIFFGWSFLVKNKIKKSALSKLNRFIEGHPEYQ